MATWRESLRENKVMEDGALQDISLNITPVDIQCACVGSSEDVGKWTVTQLKFWLKYRRLNQQGLKKDLVEKFDI